MIHLVVRPPVVSHLGFVFGWSLTGGPTVFQSISVNDLGHFKYLQAHLRDIELNTRRKTSYLQTPICILTFFLVIISERGLKEGTGESASILTMIILCLLPRYSLFDTHAKYDQRNGVFDSKMDPGIGDSMDICIKFSVILLLF